jgi:hypothetical protein
MTQPLTTNLRIKKMCAGRRSVALWRFEDKLGISGLELSWTLSREAVHVTSE